MLTLHVKRDYILFKMKCYKWILLWNNGKRRQCARTYLAYLATFSRNVQIHFSTNIQLFILSLFNSSAWLSIIHLIDWFRMCQEMRDQHFQKIEGMYCIAKPYFRYLFKNFIVRTQQLTSFASFLIGSFIQKSKSFETSNKQIYKKKNRNVNELKNRRYTISRVRFFPQLISVFCCRLFSTFRPIFVSHKKYNYN